MKTVLAPVTGLVLAAGLVLVSSAGSTHAQTFQGGPVLDQPTNGATFFAGANIKLAATLQANGSSSAVTLNFFANGQFLGAGSLASGTFLPAFTFLWTNVPAGNYQIYAQAIHPREGLTNYSKTNDIIVQPAHYISFDWISPTNLQTLAPGTIQLFAGLRDTNGSIAFAEFFDGERSLGVVSNAPVLDPPFPPGWTVGDRPYFLNWSNQSIGTHVLTIAALDTNGEVSYSSPLIVFIDSNLPPVVRIISPPNHSDFRAPVNIALSAFANDPDGQVASVQFFVGTTNLGSAQGVGPERFTPLTPTVPPPVPPLPTNTFILTWSNAPVGTFELTAIATDLYGASATSAPITLTVLAPPTTTPPPTNYPDIVDVIATDPIAIASTNCWVWRGLTNGAGAWSNWYSPVAIWRYYTNCGPKDATFTVHRFGGADSNLVVNYSLAGTATNGIDYVALPGSITIPAGQRSADITVVPIDNGSNYTHTIILALTASTNSPVTYLVAPGSRAEALVIDGALPRLAAAALLDSSFHLDLSGPDGAWFHIDWSTNLTTWTPLCTNQVVNGQIDFSDPDSATFSNRIYRVVPLPGPPSD